MLEGFYKPHSQVYLPSFYVAVATTGYERLGPRLYIKAAWEDTPTLHSIMFTV